MTSPAPLLHVSPFANEGTYQMAYDCALLEQSGQTGACVFRHYSCLPACYTFGYTQHLDEVRAKTNSAAPLVRRPTGGGIVHHQNDWTYSLVISHQHPQSQLAARASYEWIHDLLAHTLQEDFQIDTRLLPCAKKKSGEACAPARSPHLTESCAVQPVPFDVMLASDKIAGAAQKRTKDGLLIQGTIFKQHLPALDWQRFEDLFALRIASSLFLTKENACQEFVNELCLHRHLHHQQSAEWLKKR